MTVNALGGARGAINVLQTRTPGTDFFQNFTAAYQQHEESAPVTGEAEQSLKPATSLESLLGQVHMELAARRGVDATDEAAFASILNRAYASGGMDDPAAFLQTLSPEELSVVGRVHGLAVAIDPAALSKEGAYNLLLPDGYTVDFNRDGLEEIGAARTMHFPPRNAPQAFVDAWNAATEGMSEMDAASYGLTMHGALYGVNLGTTETTTAMNTGDLNSYKSVITNYLDMLEHMRGELAQGQYERDKDFFSRLQTLLNA